MKTTHNLLQGSDDWCQFRLQHDGASEAAAMLGLSLTTTRTELLRMKHTGLAREFGDWLQKNVLDKGHEVERMARPHIESIVGAELYAVTLSDGLLSASCDGLTIDDETAMEHKQWSERLAAIVRAGEVPEEHMPQCQQVLMVSGASRLIFVVSDGTPERMVYVWVYPDAAWFQRLRDGWDQFHRDLAVYVLPEAAEPAAIGKAPETLPALRIEVTGQVTASNLAEFKETALAAIRSVNRELKSDQDFADAEKAVKWCSDVEQRLAAAKDHALSQTSSIDALFKAIDDISAEARRVRLDLDKLVGRRKLEVKEEAVTAARRAFEAHIADLNGEIAPMRLQPVPADFAGAIKGKRSIESMQDALDSTMANAKIAADNAARLIRANAATFRELAAGFEFLFSDLGQIIHKPDDDFRLVLAARISAHKVAELERERKRAEAEAQRIAAAEQRAREQEASRIAAEQRRQDEEAARAATAAAQAAARNAEAQHPQQVLKAEPATADATDRGTAATTSPVGGPMGAGQAAAAAPSRAIEPAILNLGAICGRLGFTVNAAFLADTLHVHAAKVDKASRLYTETQYQAICRQIVAHVAAMAELYSGETA